MISNMLKYKIDKINTTTSKAWNLHVIDMILSFKRTDFFCNVPKGEVWITSHSPLWRSVVFLIFAITRYRGRISLNDNQYMYIDDWNRSSGLSDVAHELLVCITYFLFGERCGSCQSLVWNVRVYDIWVESWSQHLRCDDSELSLFR